MSTISPPRLRATDAPNLTAAALVQVNLRAGVHYPGPEKSVPINVGYGLQVQRDPGGSPLVRQVHLTCELGTNQVGDTLAYHGMVTAIAAYRFPEVAVLSAGEMDQIVGWSAINMLVGMIRSHVQIITAVGPYPPVILGPVLHAPLISRAMVGLTPDGDNRPLYPEQFEAVTNQPNPRTRARRKPLKRSGQPPSPPQE